jgi:DNA helicase HerA-like ATPase
MNEQEAIGYIVGGGLRDKFRVRLTVSSHMVQEGAFIVVKDDPWLFYGLVTDIQLGSTDPRFADEQSEERFHKEIARYLHGQTLFTNLEILPTLMFDPGPDLNSTLDDERLIEVDSDSGLAPRVLPVKTVPPHHTKVFLANEDDIANIFGKEGTNMFVVGETREQGYPVRIDLKQFVQRSAGIFGATGTGKSFLTRLILAGLIHQNKSSVLVFDMHNEYGYDDTASDTGQRVIGLKTKFPVQIQVVSLGRGASIRGVAADFNLEIAMKDIRPTDIELLTRELNLRETTPTTLDALVKSFGQENWFKEFKNMKVGANEEDEVGKRVPAPDSVAYWANEHGINVAAAEALHSKLRRLFNKPYILEKPASNGIKEVIKSLDSGKHVVLSFGKFDSDLDYLLVTNLLTRYIRDTWEERTNQFRSSDTQEPRQLIIILEEAHKLLNREMSSQTTFSTIAREMRKYYVTLLIVDQRPSQIYDEVMSQLGTRISGWLGDDDDIRAVLSGLAGREALRGMLARLQPKEEVLLLGWGVPMPLPVRSRRYDEEFWSDLLGKKSKSSFNPDQNIRDLGF